MNHWVSAHGEPAVCTACGEKLPYDVGEAERPLLVTGDCKGAAPIRIRTPGAERDLVLVVCTKCAHAAPYFDASYLDVEIPHGRPGWCQKCGKFIGDHYSVVPRRAPVVDLVQSLVDATRALVGT